MEKPKILIISPAAPFPLHSGADIAQHYFLKKLGVNWEVNFCCPIYDDEHSEKFLNYKKRNPSIQFFLFDKRISRWSFLNFKIQLVKILGRFQEKKRIINERDYKPYLEVGDQEFATYVNNLIETLHIKIVQIEFVQLAYLAKFLPDDVKKILVHHEIWFKAVKLRNQYDKIFSDEEIVKLISDEISLLKTFDRIVVFNKEDKKTLAEHIENSTIDVSPYGIPSELIYMEDFNRSYKRLMFIGGETHVANKHGLSWFLDEIYIPQIEMIDMEIIIIGNWSLAYIDQYEKYKKINFLGFVNDISSYFNESVLIAPILSGSGLRTKIMMAMANRVPVISTSFAAEGLLEGFHGTDPYIILFDSSEDFINLNKKIRDNPMYLERVAQLGKFFYNRRFSDERLLKKRSDILFLK